MGRIDRILWTVVLSLAGLVLGAGCARQPAGPQEIKLSNILGESSPWYHGALLKDETACIRCGLCARRCPVGLITMQAFYREGEERWLRLAEENLWGHGIRAQLRYNNEGRDPGFDVGVPPPSALMTWMRLSGRAASVRKPARG